MRFQVPNVQTIVDSKKKPVASNHVNLLWAKKPLYWLWHLTKVLTFTITVLFQWFEFCSSLAPFWHEATGRRIQADLWFTIKTGMSILETAYGVQVCMRAPKHIHTPETFQDACQNWGFSLRRWGRTMQDSANGLGVTLVNHKHSCTQVASNRNAINLKLKSHMIFFFPNILLNPEGILRGQLCVWQCKS